MLCAVQNTLLMTAQGGGGDDGGGVWGDEADMAAQDAVSTNWTE